MRFRIFAHGDRTAGDGDHEATVTIPYAPTDAEYVLFVREELKQTFEKVWDARCVNVLTEYEDEEEQRDEQAC